MSSKKLSILSSLQCAQPMLFAGLLFISTSGTGAPVSIDDRPALSPVMEELTDSAEDWPKEGASHRVRRVVGGEPANWRQYPWLAGLEQISKDKRDDLRFEKVAKGITFASPSTTHAPSVTNTSITNTTAPAVVLPVVPALKKYSETSDFECSATLVHRQWAMTAAHCLDDNKGKGLRKAVKLTFIDPVKDEVMVRTSRYYIRHPNYRSVEHGNDIAFILLDEAVDDIAPVNLDWEEITDNDIELKRLGAEVCGWGRNSAREDNYPERLQCVSLNLITGLNCNELYNPYKDRGNIRIHDSHLCAADEKYHKDACYGDSGGPLFQNRETEMGGMRTYQIGIVSEGDRCAKKRKPGVYARLSHFEHFGRCVLENGLNCDYVKNSLTKRQHYKLLKGIE
ncbi:serine protease [Endozoicomonas gorgoniicola]|uniref:Serine protease n=1 Tax=Endozoicomonas gorgoniicola TaxID=1234144 RepID=A0ABT3MVG2_9GAMM|nr:serine protease [Endozoicomonas gorgoniicola]MCW7553368.1 serine protease [Endozoicomonas gorgoniicola]